MADAGDFFLGVLIVGAGIGISFVPGLNLLSPLLYAYGTSKIIDGIVGDGEAMIRGIQVNALSSQASIPVVYGQFRVGLRINDTRLIDATDGLTPNADPDAIFSGAEDRKILARTGALCVGSEDGSGVESISAVKFYAEPTTMIFTVAINSALSNSGVNVSHQDHLKYHAQLGTDAQQNHANLRDQLGWTATMDGRGLAYIAFFMLFDTDKWRGVPNVTCLIKGNKLYDPRSSLFEFPNYASRTGANPALVVLDYLTSKRYGGGVPYAARDGGSLDFIDEASFIAAANYCEQQVSIPPSGTEDRFGFNGAVNTSRVVGENLADMLATCRAQLIWQGGKFRMVIGQVTTAEAFELTEDNILSIEFVRKGADIPNSIQAAYVETVDGDFVEGTVLWPLVGDTTLLDEDNGMENRAEVLLPFTTGRNQAIRTIMVLLREARQDVFASIVATQAAMQLEVGNVVKTTHEGPGWVQQELVVREMSLTIDGRIQLGLQKYDAASYTLDSLTAAPSTPTTNLPNPYNVDPPSTLVFTSDATTALSTQEGGIVPRILLAWTASPDQFLARYEVEFKLNAESEWRVEPGNPDLLATDVHIIGVTNGASYDVRVRAVNRVGQKSVFITLTGQVVGTIDSVRLLQAYLTSVPFVGTAAGGGITESILPDSDISFDLNDWYEEVGLGGLFNQLAETDDFGTSTEPFFFDTGLVACPTKRSTSFEVGLANPVGTPAGSADQTMKLHGRLSTFNVEGEGGGAGEGITDWVVELFEGVSLRATLTVLDVAVNQMANFEYTLSNAEVDSIGNHDNLSIKATCSMCTEPNTLFLWGTCNWVKCEYINKTVIERGVLIDLHHVPSSEVDEYDFLLKWDEGAGQQTHSYTQAITAGLAGTLRLEDVGPVDFFFKETFFDFSVDVTPVGQPGDVTGSTTILFLQDEVEDGGGIRVELSDLTIVRSDYFKAGAGITITLDADGRPIINTGDPVPPGPPTTTSLADLTDVSLANPIVVSSLLAKTANDWVNRTVAQFGPWRGANGTALLPTWSFEDAQSTGAYRPAANSYAIATNGLTAISISAAQIVTLNNPLAVGSGGTGIAALAVGDLLLGGGSGPMTNLASGAAGGFVRSDGLDWVRSTIQASDLPAHSPSAHTHPASDITTGTFGAGDFTFLAKITMSGATGTIDFTGAAGKILFKDNEAAPFQIGEGFNLYMGFVSTDGAEKVEFAKPVTMSSTLAVAGTIFAGPTITRTSGQLTVRAPASSALVLGANAVEKARITAGGALLLGKTSGLNANGDLDMAGTLAVTGSITSGDSVWDDDDLILAGNSPRIFFDGRSGTAVGAIIKVGGSNDQQFIINLDPDNVSPGSFFVFDDTTSLMSVDATNLSTLNGVNMVVAGTLAVAGAATFGTYTGQSSIVTLGTISTGVWNGTTIGVARGGTGLSNPAENQVMLTNGSSAFSLVDHGSSGNVLRSNGSDWFSAQLARNDISGVTTVAQGGTGQSSWIGVGRLIQSTSATVVGFLDSGADRGVIRSNGTQWVRVNGMPSATINAGTFTGSFTFATPLPTASTTAKVISVVGGTGIDSTGGENPSLTFDASELTLLSSGLAASDHIVVADAGVSKRALISGISVGLFGGTLPAAQVAAGTLAGSFIFSSVLQVVAGSAAAPAIRGPSASDNGFYIPTGTAVGITSRGVERLLVQSTTTTAGWIEIRRAQIGNLPIAIGLTSAIDFNRGNFFTIDNATGGTTAPTFSNDRAGFTYLIIINPGSGAVNSWTWPSGVVWLEGVAPTLSVNSTYFDQIHLTSIGGGNLLGSYTIGHR